MNTAWAAVSYVRDSTYGVLPSGAYVVGRTWSYLRRVDWQECLCHYFGGRSI